MQECCCNHDVRQPTRTDLTVYGRTEVAIYRAPIHTGCIDRQPYQKFAGVDGAGFGPVDAVGLKRLSGYVATPIAFVCFLCIPLPATPNTIAGVLPVQNALDL